MLAAEQSTLERQEKKLMGDIKKEAKAGRNDSAKIMAKDLVRTRAYIKKMYKKEPSDSTNTSQTDIQVLGSQ